MALSHGEHDVALPHAGLLAYFQPRTMHAQDCEHAPPPYEGFNGSRSTPFVDHNEAKDVEGESEYDFWSECDCPESEQQGLSFSTMKRDHRGFYAFCCFWCAVSVCILGAVGTFFAIDLVFSHFGTGTGLAMWMVHGNPSQAITDYDMSFCLASPNRQAPGPQVWRYIRPDNYADCTTEVVTLSAASSEQWKLQLSDEILFGDDLPTKTGHERGNERGDRFISVEEKVRMEEYGEGFGGDDLAEEATARWWTRSVPNDDGEAQV